MSLSQDDSSINIVVTAPSDQEASSVAAFLASTMEASGFESVSVIGEQSQAAPNECLEAMRNMNPGIFAYDVTIEAGEAKSEEGPEEEELPD